MSGPDAALSMDDRRWDLVAVFLVAIAVRFLTFPWWHDLPFGGDEQYYWILARDIAAGNELQNALFLRPPLQAVFLSVAALGSSDPVGGRIAVSLVGALIAPLILVLARREFSPTAGLVAGLVWALYPNAIGFSHYLWSETLYVAMLLGTLAWCFPGRPRPGPVRLSSTSALLSLCLLAKEAAVLSFAALLASFVWRTRRVCLRPLAVASLLFLLVPGLYSAVVSHEVGRPTFVSEAAFYNANEARHGRTAWQLPPERSRRLFFVELGSTLAAAPARLTTQTANLWTPTSFPIHRLLEAPARFGNYRAPMSGALAGFAVAAYVLVVVLGIAGLVTAARTPFWTFSVASIVLLTLSGAVFLMASRFRLVAMPFLVLYAAAFLSSPRAGLESLRKPTRLAAGIVCLAIFAGVLWARWSTIGDWG